MKGLGKARCPPVILTAWAPRSLGYTVQVSCPLNDWPGQGPLKGVNFRLFGGWLQVFYDTSPHQRFGRPERKALPSPLVVTAESMVSSSSPTLGRGGQGQHSLHQLVVETDFIQPLRQWRRE